MAKDPPRDKPSFRNLPTGAAQPVTNSVERAHEHFKGHPEPAAPPSNRKKFRTPDQVEEPKTPDGHEPSSGGLQEGEED